jgi:hypothetical protein
MMEHNSLGRVTILSPVTWKDGWPYFGLPGNLGRTPRTWVKPDTGSNETPHAPYQRNDDFSGALANVWQWNHVPVDGAWSLSERPGFLRLHTLPAKNFWEAKNSLTQRAIGPVSTVTAVLDASGLKPGDVAGLALLNLPYAQLGVEKSERGLSLVQYDQQSGKIARRPLKKSRIWLRAESDYLKDISHFSYSLDGRKYVRFGTRLVQPYQGITFQGVRNALFAFNTTGAPGGFADFDSFSVVERYPHGLRRPIPYGQDIALKPAGKIFTVIGRGLGRVSLRANGKFLSVAADGATAMTAGQPGTAETFQWMEAPDGSLVLMALQTNRYLRLDKARGQLIADSPGPVPDGSDGVRFQWEKTK